MGQRSAVTQVNTSVTSTAGTPNLKTDHELYLQLNPYFEFGKWGVGLELSDTYYSKEIVESLSYLGGGQFLNHPINLQWDNMALCTLNLYYYGFLNHFDFNLRSTYFNAVYKIQNKFYRYNNLTADIMVGAYWNKFYFDGYLQAPYKNNSVYGDTSYTITYGIGVSYKLKNVRLSLRTRNIGYNHRHPRYSKDITQPHYRYKGEGTTPEINNYICFGISYSLQYGRSYQSANRSLYNTATDDSVLRVVE